MTKAQRKAVSARMRKWWAKSTKAKAIKRARAARKAKPAARKSTRGRWSDDELIRFARLVLAEARR